MKRKGESSWKRGWRRLAAMVCICLAACGLLGGAAAEGRGETEKTADAPKTMQLHQVDVGCANCHLLICGETVILVDGGTNWYGSDLRKIPATGDTPEKMLDYVAKSGIDHIDAHFVTHYHNDHALQIPDFSRLYGRDSTVVFGTSEELPEKFAPLPNGTYRHLKDGDELDVGPFHVQCVGPAVVRREGEINEDSLNLLITFGFFRMLFTGDYMADDVWKEHEEEIRDVDVFVWPHHGLEPFPVTSSSLQILNPKVVLVPGASPSQVRFKLQRLHLTQDVYSNFHGNVVITSDGETFDVNEHVAPGAFADRI